jgi:nitroimidazol reductase NimA-like FMN-containing flavoprotein (pyridoxamine 5'-phosphate oxidase superfamily)
MPDGAAPEIIRSMLESQTTGVLATERDRRPYTNLVAYSFNPELTQIYFATPCTTVKYGNLSMNPNCSLLVDCRKNDRADFSGDAALTAVGRAVEITGGEKNALMRAHAERLPGLAGFLASPAIALFRIEVESYILVSGLSDVAVYHP